MLTSKVVAHFGGNFSAVARAAGVTRQAVQQWGKFVPAYTAQKLAAENGLELGEEDYASVEHLRRIRISRTMRRTLANSRRAEPVRKKSPPPSSSAAET
jgi:hypothetical protein